MTYAYYGNTVYKYGDMTRYYGVVPASNSPQWGVDVDWDGDGIYSGDNEAPYAIGLRIRRGRQTYININSDGNASGFEPVRVGTCVIMLDNSTRRYDPYNTASPLYPYVLPGRFVRIRVLENGTVHDVFAGKTKSITSIDDGESQTVMIEVEDGLRLLQSADSSVSLTQNITIDTAIGNVLTDVDYPALWGTNLDASADVLSYWWAEKKAASEIRDLADAELGNFFIAANGNATFKSRHNTASAILTLSSADLLKSIDIPQPLSVIRNSIKIKAHPLDTAAAELWRMADMPSIAAGASLTVWASYTYNAQSVPAINVISPVATTDYTMNTLANGTGTNLTASFTVAYTDFGKTGKIVITNNSASVGFVTLLKVRGDAVYSPDVSLLVQDDATSQGIYGKALLTLDNNWFQNTSIADDFSRWLISYMPSPQKFATVKIEARPDIQFTPELFDTLSLTVAKLSISGVTYQVAGIEHEWISNNGQATRTTWILEPKPDNSAYWRFTTQLDVTSVFGF